MPTSDILNIAKLGLFASQQALKVTSHNISNANTPGYAMQVAHFSPNPGLSSIKSASGDGVIVDQVSRNVDSMVEKRLLVGERELGRLTARDRFLSLIENTFNDASGTGLSKDMENFFTATDGLADNPGNPVARSQVVAAGDNLARRAQEMASSLSRVTLPVDNEITYQLQDINSRLQGLQKINFQIIQQESSSSPALDLKDQRQQMIKELSGLVDIQTFNSADGGVTVMTSGGKLLMDHSYVASFARGGTPGTGITGQGITLDNSPDDISNSIKGGQLKGLMEVRDEIINGSKGVLSQLNEMIGAIRYQVNKVTSVSVGGTMSTSQTGVFDLGTDFASSITTLVATPASGAPADLKYATTGVVRIAYGTNANNLQTTSININPNMSLTAVKNAFDASPAVSAAIVSGKLVLTAKAGVYGVIDDSSNVLAGLGVGAFFSGQDAASMGVNPDLITNPQLVTAGKITFDAGGTPVFNDANNMGSLAMGALRSAQLPLGGFSATMAEHLADLVGTLGSLVKNNQDLMTTQTTTINFISDLRESVSGVSLEEELTNVIKFQRAFQASGKVVTMADELIQSVLAMVK